LARSTILRSASKRTAVRFRAAVRSIAAVITSDTPFVARGVTVFATAARQVTAQAAIVFATAGVGREGRALRVCGARPCAASAPAAQVPTAGRVRLAVHEEVGLRAHARCRTLPVTTQRPRPKQGSPTNYSPIHIQVMPSRSGYGECPLGHRPQIPGERVGTAPGTTRP
jgi:hypothetical protein